MGGGVSGQRRWRSAPNLAEPRQRQQEEPQASSSPVAVAYPTAKRATSQAAGRRKTKNPFLRAVRAITNAPSNLGRAAGVSQQPPPLPPRAGRPPPPPTIATAQLSQQVRDVTPLGFMPERAFGLEQQPVAVAATVQGSLSTSLSSSTFTLATANGQTSPAPAPSGGKYLSQSCSNLTYGEQGRLYPPLSPLDTIEQQESGSDSDDGGGQSREERSQQPVYTAVDSDQERGSPRNTATDREEENETPVYADLEEMLGPSQHQATCAVTDPHSERLSRVVRAAAQARIMSLPNAAGHAEPSAPPMPSDYTMSRSTSSTSAVRINRLGDRFINAVTQRRKVYDDVHSVLVSFICRASEHKAAGDSRGGLAPQTVANDTLLVQRTLKELYYLHSVLHGHAAEDMSLELLPEVGQKAYSFWESLHNVILKHHEELDQSEAACAAEILRNPSAGHLNSVLEEHFKMQRFLLQRQRVERNAELSNVHCLVSTNASWAAAAAAEAPGAAAAAGLEVTAALLAERTNSKAAAPASHGGSVIVAEGRAAPAATANASHDPGDRMTTVISAASQVGRNRLPITLTSTTRALPNNYQQLHAVGAREDNVSARVSVVAQSVKPHVVGSPTPATPDISPSALSADAAAAAAAAGNSTVAAVSPPTPDAAAERADAGKRRPVEATHSSQVSASAAAKVASTPRFLNSTSSVQATTPVTAATDTVRLSDVKAQTLTDGVAHRVESACNPASVDALDCHLHPEASFLSPNAAASQESSPIPAACSLVMSGQPVKSRRQEKAAISTSDECRLRQLSGLTEDGRLRSSQLGGGGSGGEDGGLDCAGGELQLSDAPVDGATAATPTPAKVAPPRDAAAGKAATKVSPTLTLSLSADRKSDDVVAHNGASGDDGEGADSTYSNSHAAMAAVRATDETQPIVSSDNLVYMLNDSKGCAERSPGGEGGVTSELATNAIGTAQGTLSNVAAGAEGGSRGRNRRPVAAPRNKKRAHGQVELQQQQQRKQEPHEQEQTERQPTAEQSELHSQPKDLTALVSVAPAGEEAGCATDGEASRPTTLAGGVRVQESIYAQLSRLPPSATAPSAGSAPGGTTKAGAADEQPGSRIEDERIIAVQVPNSSGRPSATDAEEQAEYYELCDDAADIDNAVLSATTGSVAPKSKQLSSPGELPAVAASGSTTAPPLPPCRSSGSSSSRRLSVELSEEQQQYASYEVLYEDTCGDAVQRSTTIDPSAARSAAATKAGLAGSARLTPRSPQSASVKSSVEAESFCSDERAASIPPADQGASNEPLYETLPCDKVQTVGGDGAQVSIVQRIALKPLEDVLRGSVGRQQPLPPLPAANGASSAKSAAGVKVEDKSSEQKPEKKVQKKKNAAKISRSSASRYALLTDDDDESV